jgi:hypothetical protein
VVDERVAVAADLAQALGRRERGEVAVGERVAGDLVAVGGQRAQLGPREVVGRADVAGVDEEGGVDVMSREDRAHGGLAAPVVELDRDRGLAGAGRRRDE